MENSMYSNSMVAGFDLRLKEKSKGQIAHWEKVSKSGLVKHCKNNTILSADESIWFSPDYKDFKNVVLDFIRADPKLRFRYDFDSITCNYFSLLNEVPTNWIEKRLPKRVGNVCLIAISFNKEIVPSRWHSEAVYSSLSFEKYNWQFLGYDVCDRMLYSGLHNTKFSQEEIHKYKNFRSLINKCGLFNSEEDAIEFCSITNLRIPDHKPFYPVSIWRNEDHQTSKGGTH